MTKDEVLNIFRECGAMLEGHFILSSGLRSPVFLQKAKVFQYAAQTEKLYATVITMESVNRPGSLAQISAAIAACDANINNLVMRMISPDFHQMIFEIEVRDLAQLTDVLATLKRSPGLSAVQRAGIREAGMISTLEWDGKVDRRFVDDER